MTYKDDIPDILSILPTLTEEKTHRSVAKVRMVHTIGKTIIIPEFIFCMKGYRFLVPTSFSAPMLSFLENDNVLNLYFRVHDDVQLQFRTTSTQHFSQLADGSHLFRGELFGPKLLSSLFSGMSCWNSDRSSFDLRLFHHTNWAAKNKIQESAVLKSSSWNYQGTKKLKNISYAYLTCKFKIKDDRDLQDIGMSSQGKLLFQCDDTAARVGPKVAFDVYRESTKNRTARLLFWTPVEVLAPQHIIQHDVLDEGIYYEMSAPKIHRIPLEPDKSISITENHLCPELLAIQFRDYVVIADATCTEGIGACLNEEETNRVFKFEPSPEQDLLSFWKSNKNSDLYSGKKISPVVFQ